MDVQVAVTAGRARLFGLVGSDAEREATLVVMAGVSGVTEVSSDATVLRRRVR